LIKKISNIYLPLFIYSLFGLVIFASFGFWIAKEMDNINSELEELEIPANRGFAVLLEFHSKGRKFTYQVSDERGRIHEITEVVDEATSRKLRVGDTISIYRKTITIFGKRTVISKIMSSVKTYSPLRNLYNYTFNGSIFFSILSFGSVILLIVNKQNQ
jgi:hypothetical protein